MSWSLKMPSEVNEALKRGWTVVTGNQRAARTVREAYNAQKRAEGARGWEPPPVFAWDTWLQMLWRRLVLEGRASALLLNAHQEHAVWREVLAGDSELAASLRSLDSLAELAAGGWELLNRFRAARMLRRFGFTADTRAFARWAAEFEGRCGREGYVSRARLPELLAKAFANGELGVDTRPGLLMVGFDRQTPDQIELLAAAERAGWVVDQLAPSTEPVQTGFLARAPNDQVELETCARWVRQFLRAHPDARTAVIVPGLGELRSRVDRTFREILAPELENITAGTASGPYEFSLGVPLASTALARTALDLLAWAVRPLPVENVSRLLLSPYFAGGGEYVARAELDAFVLRRETLLVPELSVADLGRVARGWSMSDRIDELREHWADARRLLEREKPSVGDRSHAAWCALFGQMLDAWGWDSGRPEHSLEFQVRRRWDDVQDQVASLDFDGRRVSYTRALEELTRIAESTLFAPESHGAPVQVMGPLEAAGSRFDAIWFLRAGDLSWPAATGANPLLPIQLQRELGMPGADPALEMQHARRVAARVAASAETVVFSYARETADSHQRPSAALAGLELKPVEAETLAGPETARAPVAVERIPDEVPIPALPDGVIRGGSQILQLQAACGFRAFAEKRLGSSGLDAPLPGLDAMERGNLVHVVLEEVWKELKTQSRLGALTVDQRQELLSTCIEQAMTKHSRNAPGWALAYLEVEHERLLKLLGNWLEKELERPAFAVLRQEEKVDDFTLGPLRINVRPDRLDVLLKDGEPAGEIVVDYKTGSVTPAAWKGERPDEPQVPLYALSRSPESLAGVAFGRIRPGSQMALVGYQTAQDVLTGKGKVQDLPAQLSEWRRVLTRLAEEFSQGNAAVDPKQYPTTCRYCQQRLVCRLNPKTLDAENLEDLGDPEWDPEAENA